MWSGDHAISFYDGFTTMQVPGGYFGSRPFVLDNNIVWEEHDEIYVGTVVPAPGAVLLATLGLSLAGWKLRRREEL